MAAAAVLYNLKQTQKGKELERVLRTLNYRVIFPDPSGYGKPVGELIGAKAKQTVAGSGLMFGVIDEEMLLLWPNSEMHLDLTLKMLRQNKAGVSLKAVLTNENSGWNSYQLFRELKKEAAAFTGK